MSDNEIEDVSFLPGESLHRKAVYEPNIIHKLRLLPCTRTRLAVTTIITLLIILVIALASALSHKTCDSLPSTSELPTKGGKSKPTGPTEDYISTNNKPFPYRDIRLPTNVIPISYDLFLHPNISRSVYTGNVNISCEVKSQTDFIVFHIKTLNITSLNLKNSENGAKLVISEYLEYKTNEQVYVKLGSSLSAGLKVTLEVKFDGELTSKLAGFYKSMYKTKAGEERYIATTHFEPTDARAAFPCFDEPAMKATFQLTMIRDTDHISLFNMPQLSSTEYLGVLRMDKFHKSVKMSSYLVAFVVCDYAVIKKSTKRNITVGVYAPKDVINSAHFALETAVSVIDHYEDYFGVQYPLPKQDLIAIPDFAAGAMENWGLITYRMTAILYEEGVSSARNKQWVAVVIAHELAHQWFGNLVTMAWWDDLWLNEGFASYVEYIGSAFVKPDWKMKEQFVTETLLSGLYQDSLSNSHPINIPVHNPSEINEIFDAISYDKGASIIRMLSNFLGNETFKAGLTSYLNKYKFKNAATTDLWASLSGAVAKSNHGNIGTDVHSLMETWTEQMGYPVITLDRTGIDVTMTQSRFLLYDKSNDTGEFTSPFGYKWQVPFSYTTSVKPGTVNKILLKDSTGVFKVDGGTMWIKGNSGMNGYYRVNYDTKTWTALIKQLHTDHTIFSPAERAGIIDDAFVLARAGHISMSIPLDLSNYMVNEEDFLPWDTLIGALAYIEQRIETKAIYYNYKMYLLKLMSKQLTGMKWSDDGSHLEKYLRAAILGKALNLGHKESITQGLRLFEQWKKDKTSINVNLKAVIYKVGIVYGSEEDWEFVWTGFLSESQASEQHRLLGVLGHTRDGRLLSRLLDYSLNKTKVRSQDTALVMTSVTTSTAGQLLAWRFLKQNWKTFYDRYASTSFILSRVIKTVTSRFDTQFDYEEVKTFFQDKDTGSGSRAVAQALEKIQMNIDWLSRYEQEVTDWFEKHGNKSR